MPARRGLRAAREAGALLDRLASRYGYRLVATSRLFDWQLRDDGAAHGTSALSLEASAYLRRGHPRLRELVARYAAADAAVTTATVWTEEYVSDDDLRHFRGDNAYVWQVRHVSEVQYALVAYYLKTLDRHGLLDRLEEDGAFGAFTFDVDGRTVSRDLLDSVSELLFLDRHLGLATRAGLRVLDVGAGYGRLACRAAAALDGLGHYYCTDAVATSTFLSEFYVGFRGLTGRVSVVPLDELDARIAPGSIDAAVNIHSFSECSLGAIDWWVRRLRALRVRHLMVAPNAAGCAGAELRTTRGEDFLPVLSGGGYRLRVKEPKYADPVVQKNGLYPTHYWLFELEER
jgi:hypothetical protein